jgi:DNA-damage-inducible protein D
MANSDKLAEVVALLHERDEVFEPFELLKTSNGTEEPLWSMTSLKELLGYDGHESLDRAMNDAKIVAGNSKISIRDNFVDGSIVGHPGEMFVTKYAAYLIVMRADVLKPNVALAQTYFARQVNRQEMENEKRLKTRLDVATENHKLNGVAKVAGVTDFMKFHGVGVAALYGGKTVAQIQAMKGLKRSEQHLDFAGSEELAANLFRITQTAAALRRQIAPSEQQACDTHKKVGAGIRAAIVQAGNLPPERLPKAELNIGKVATKVKKSLK